MYCDITTGNASSFSNGYYETSSWTPAAIASAKCGCVGNNATSVVASVEDMGRYYSRCVACPPGTTPDTAAGVCMPDDGAIQSNSADLSDVISELNADQQAGINPLTATQVGATSHPQPCPGGQDIGRLHRTAVS